jgi:hypothetical protein
MRRFECAGSGSKKQLPRPIDFIADSDLKILPRLANAYRIPADDMPWVGVARKEGR